MSCFCSLAGLWSAAEMFDVGAGAAEVRVHSTLLSATNWSTCRMMFRKCGKLMASL